MPFAKRSGTPSQIDEELKTRRQKIIEEDRIRLLRESLMLFYDKLLEKYELIHPIIEEPETENIQAVNREEVEAYAAEYANTKPLGF
jgi:hypothetical protein